MAARKQATAHLRERVLEASVALIEDRGIGGLSMREVARRAGVSHQAPYHHFADREAILAAVALEGFERMADSMEAAVGPDPLASLTAVGRAYVRFALEHPAHFRVMFRPELVALPDHPEAEACADRAYLGLEGLVAQAVATGAVPAAEAPGLVTICWAFVHGLSGLLLDGPLADKTPAADLQPRIDGAFETFERLLRGYRS